uniref:SWIM-type domain-containing protein n=1 Tax=Setaria viridis TaxID=4556 RepID=A0A4V6D7Y3_SETVI|nr:hypothetical protein SEVIR_4G059100v2 [Setaria viridis]
MDAQSDDDEENGSQELTEEEVEAFIRSEQLAAFEGNDADIDNKYMPQIGMEFKDRHDAHYFFSFYGFLAGFEVVVAHVTRTTSKKKNNEVYKQEMKYHSPQNRNQLFSGRKYMTDMKKGMIITLNDNNIPTRKMIAILLYLRGGLTTLPYKTKDVQNIRTKINREVTGNDMTQAMDYFKKRKKEDPTLYYRFQVDKDMKVKNLFWREGISLQWYAEYGECVSFETTLAEMFEDTVYFSVTEDEFEMLWQKMISDFKLENNKYFNKMWNKRKIFIPVYYKNDFYPFIQSTGRSEGTNARFKDNVGPTYSLVSFLREYQRIIDVIRNKEEIDDNQSKQKMPKELYYGYTIEQQAVELYNWNIYLKFMNQLRQTESYKYKETEKAKCFELWYKSNQIKESCLCGKFNKDGIFCTHILKVIVEEEVKKIPEKYFIDRWRKKEKKIAMPLFGGIKQNSTRGNSGRPKKPKRLMGMVEQERERMRKAEAKKKNKKPAIASKTEVKINFIV